MAGAELLHEPPLTVLRKADVAPRQIFVLPVMAAGMMLTVTVMVV